jgi:uncharacterized NAD-dependent epimerase/dehydratase family protein
MTSMIELKSPYLLFLGDTDSLLSAKTASGIAHWRPERCLGQLRLSSATVDLGLPDMTIGAAREAGAMTLVIGLAPLGGAFPEAWTAERGGARVLDVRVPPEDLPCGSGQRRPGKRLLTVGSDCVVGKMFTALAIDRELKQRGEMSDFRATGQTGILIEGSGIAVDAVVSDFLSGAVEVLAPANDPDHWDIIEGQGSLFHPAYAGVSLGLLHGAQADYLVLCHEAGRSYIDGDEHAGFPIPALGRVIATNLDLARLTNPGVKLAGISLNSSSLGEAEAGDIMESLRREFDVPVVDPVRTGVAPIVDRLS